MPGQRSASGWRGSGSAVGLGSDFDGAMIPKAFGTAAGQSLLVQAMRTHGYGEALIRKIAHENWLRVLEATWGG